MSSLRSKLATLTYRAVASAPLPVPESWSPTFLVGCGRSGTTFLVSALNQHPHALALNEPRHIWRAVDPRTDIWDEHAEQSGAQISFSAEAATERAKRRCRRMFFARQIVSGKRRLIEKLPINNFRLPWIDAMFPNAKYLNLVRNGLDVARSIQQKGAAWHGRGGWKWRSMEDLSRQYGMNFEEMTGGDEFFRRGIVEWTLSLSQSSRFLSNLDAARKLTVRYEDLVKDPRENFDRILDFLGLDSQPVILQRMCNQVASTAPSSRRDESAIPLPRTTRDLLIQYGYEEVKNPS